MNLLQRILGAIIGVALLIASFVFASVILATAAILALIVWGWILWRTRHLRRQMKEAEAKGPVIIEGEFREESEVVDRIDDRR